MKLSRLLPLLAAALACAACGLKIEGETSNPPPPGGPKASSDHPPGEVPAASGQSR